MDLNPLKLVGKLVDQVDYFRRSRFVGNASKAASGIASRLQTLEQYIPVNLRKNHGEVQHLSPMEVARIYSQLSPKEKDVICGHIKVAASDALTTMEGIAPIGKNLTRRAIGRLVLPLDPVVGKRLSMHNILVELWDRDFGGDDILQRGTTDREGRFELWYDPGEAGKIDRPDLELRVFEIDHFFKQGKLHFKQKLIYTIKGASNVTRQTYDFGECEVPYWQYNPQTLIPRLLVVKNGTAPQSFTPGRALVMAMELAPLELKKARHRRGNCSLQEVQQDYGDNLTITLERANPGCTRTDEYFGARILNGMAASILDRDPELAGDPKRRNWYRIHHHWNSYEQDGVHDAPNVDIYLELQGDDKLMPVEIKLQFREAGDRSANAKLRDAEVYTPDDPKKWLQAKRVARASAALHAELDVHLAGAHFNIEQYAVAAHRNLRKSPLRPLLMPHLKEVVLINQEADSWLLGENGFISRAQALTADGINRRVQQVMGTLDWKGWKPRKKISRHHLYAIAGRMFWDTVNSYVDKYFIENEKRLKKHWYEVHRFSNDLVSYSAPLYLCPYLRQHLVDGQLPDWFESNERMDLRGRSLDKDAKAISPITATDQFTNDDDLKNVKQVCSYIIYHATFFHHWPNSKQLDDGGELAYCSLGLRHGKHGVMTDENDESVLPPPELASEQLWFAHTLSKTRSGFIMGNEDQDVPPGFADALRSREPSFKDIFDIRKLPSRLNI